MQQPWIVAWIFSSVKYSRTNRYIGTAIQLDRCDKDNVALFGCFYCQPLEHIHFIWWYSVWGFSFILGRFFWWLSVENGCACVLAIVRNGKSILHTTEFELGNPIQQRNIEIHTYNQQYKHAKAPCTGTSTGTGNGTGTGTHTQTRTSGIQYKQILNGMEQKLLAEWKSTSQRTSETRKTYTHSLCPG